MVDHRRTPISIHEAGHAVIGRVLRLVCGDASILPDDDGSLGWAHIENPLHPWQRGDGSKRALADAFCVALFAGAEAERVILGNNDVGDSTDCDRATACLKEIGVRNASYVGDEAWERYEAKLRRNARQLVIRHRGLIEQVAGVLSARQTLSAAEIDAVLGIGLARDAEIASA
jgi:hypothetical protein